MQSQPGSSFLYIGTYTDQGSQGVYRSRFDSGTGAFEPPVLAAALANPTFLARHPRLPVIYAVSETRDAGGRHGSGVNAFAMDPVTGELTLLNRQSSGGAGPCHLTVAASGQCLLTANYAAGSVALLPLLADGRLGGPPRVIQHEGASRVDPERQEGPHAHSVTLAPDQRFAFVADLGLDRTLVYHLDAGAGTLQPHDPPYIASPPGSGPRHFAFHPNGRFAYLIHELDNTFTAFAYDAARGVLTPIQTLSALPPGFTGTSYAADVHLTPDGTFLYGSNRGHDSLVICRVDAASGRLTVTGHVPSGGAWPRNFTLTASGDCLLAANQNDGAVACFRCDARTGGLARCGTGLQVSRPVCLLLVDGR